MVRKWLYAVAFMAVVVGFGLTWALTRSDAEQGPGEGGGKAGPALPIAQVVLFNNGVGYFQREGDVSGDTHIDLTFPTSDVNDLLKSLVLQDTAGGHIGAISYDSQDPIDKILHSFALDLNNNPTFAQILNQARGEKIEVLRQEKPGANPFKVSGTIIGVEVHQQATDKGAAVEVEQLNLLSSEGMLSIPLTQVLSVHFLNPTLENEFRRALQILARAHDVQKKTVTLQFNGNGKRAVRVGYVVERPIWKTTYRLVLDNKGKLFMQGWALVENTSDDDWNNVRMVLVSAKPISYRMDLYAPLYIPRPLVEPELFASLRPPLYDGALGPNNTNLAIQGAARAPYYANPQAAGSAAATTATTGFIAGSSSSTASTQFPMLSSSGMGGFGGGGFGGAGGFPGGGFGGAGGFPGGGFGGAGGFPGGGGFGGLNTAKPITTGQAALQNGGVGVTVIRGLNDNKLLYEEMMARKNALKNVKNDASKVGGEVGKADKTEIFELKDGVQSVASAEEIGDYFQYVIDQKINLPRQKSAMMPIVNQGIEGAKVSIYNEAVHAKYPLLGVRLKNTSGKPLTQGPITVFDDNSYAGDTRILDLQPNEERLLSYAMDQATEVKTTTKTHPGPEMNLKLDREAFTATYSLRQTKTYTLKNRGTIDRTVLIEHPIREDWKLVDPKKPKEQTRDTYRFEIVVKVGETVQQEVIEEQTRIDPLSLFVAEGYYALAEGITVKPVVTAQSTALMALKIAKGMLEVTSKESESKTYFIQNVSDRDHNFTVDHIIRKDWKRIDKSGKDQEGPAVFRFNLEVKSKQTGQQEVAEHHVFKQKRQAIGTLDEEALREFIAHPAPTAKVKDALQQVLDKVVKIHETKLMLEVTKGVLKILSEDQARVRENLKIIPQTAEAYKDFLKKFVTQETQIEEAQSSIRATEAQVGRLQKEFETFVAALTVE